MSFDSSAPGASNGSPESPRNASRRTTIFRRPAYRILRADFVADNAGPGDGISLSSVALNCEILAHDGNRVPAAPDCERPGWRGLFRAETRHYH